jgi:hypothetical protein
MPYANSAVFWFAGLLVVLVIGFWQSYFSVFFGDMHGAHHAHGLAMLAWVLLLIHQAWRVRTRNLASHRKIGKLAYFVAPIIAVSGIWVTFHNIARFDDPLQPAALSIFLLGLYSVFLYTAMFALAMIHRRNVQFHGRYMVATALVFLVPGLGRLMRNYVAPAGLPALSFYQCLWVPFAFAVVLLLLDWRKGRTCRPFTVFLVLYAIQMLLWHLLPHVGLWQRFTVWSASLGF